MIDARFHEYPEMKAVAESENFQQTLSQILEFEEVDQKYLPQIEMEVVVVLTLYAPLRELAQNITETTGLPSEKAANIANLVETLLLQPVSNELLAYDYLWQEELAKVAAVPTPQKDAREELRLRPEGVTRENEGANEERARPLTREEVLKALAPTRTMASDIETLRKKAEGEK